VEACFALTCKRLRLIAISILAQMVSYRWRIKPRPGKKSAKMGLGEFDREVWEETDIAGDDEKAVAAVLSVKGPVPGKAF
jgi:hypothetical protein